MITETVYTDMETDLIFKVLSGEASEIEQQQVEQWKSISVKNASEFDALQMYWKRNNELQENEIETGFDRGLRELKEEITRRTKIQRWRKRITVGAVIIVCGSGIFMLTDYLVRKSFERNILKFEEAKMVNVITIMEEKYNVSIELPSSLKECVFSGSMYNPTLQSSLAWVSRSMGWNVIKTSDTIYRIEGVGCNSTNETIQLK